MGWENFYTRRLYDRIIDVFNRPICSSPSAWITVQERKPHPETSELIQTGKERRCLNLGSYNYLGFADDWMNTCGEPVLKAAREWPTSCGGTRTGVGTTPLHRKLEAKVAKFVGKEDAVVFNMGYGTNSATVPALVGRGDLIVSDELNHSSIVAGCRASGALIRSFKHNDAKAHEKALAQDFGDGRGHLQHGGRDLRFEEHFEGGEEVQGVLVFGRGPLHRCLGRHGKGLLRALRRRPGGCRHPHGHIYEELRRDGRVCRFVQGRGRPPPEDLSWSVSARRDVADHVCPGSKGPGHCFWDRQRLFGERQNRRAQGQFELLPVRIAGL